MTPTDLLLTEQTRPEVEAAVIAEARRRARRRRRTYGVVVVIATVIVAAVFAVLDRTPPSRGTAPAGGSRGVVTAVEQSKGVAWCVPDPDGRGDPIDGEELVVGEGAPVRTWCSFGAMAGALVFLLLVGRYFGARQQRRA